MPSDSLSVAMLPPGKSVRPTEQQKSVSPEKSVEAPPSLASEDFALYRKYVPSFFYWIGSTAASDPVEELHRPGFHTDDTALRYSAQIYAASVLEAGK